LLVRKYFGSQGDHDAVIAEDRPALDALRSWLVEQVASELRVSPESISAESPLDSFALESISVAALQSGLSDWLGFRVPYTLFLQYPTIEAIARHLAVPAAVVSRAQEPSSLLLELTSARPFFCVGGALGAAYYLLKLARDVGVGRRAPSDAEKAELGELAAKLPLILG
jgi:acyl carrier protein